MAEMNRYERRAYRRMCFESFCRGFVMPWRTVPDVDYLSARFWALTTKYRTDEEAK